MIKQFTLRFDRNNPTEAEAMDYLKAQAEHLGISQNTFLIRLLQKEMAGADHVTDLDKAVERIVNGVTEKLSAAIQASPVLLPVSAFENSDLQTEENVGAGGMEQLSEDAMDFLSCF